MLSWLIGRFARTGMDLVKIKKSSIDIFKMFLKIVSVKKYCKLPVPLKE